MGAARQSFELMSKAESVFNIDTGFNLLSLHSHDASRFTLASGNVSQWLDVSVAANHAIQGTAANRPAYNSGELTFDGTNDSLILTNEIAASTFSLYVVFKNTDVGVARALLGGDGPGNNQIYFNAEDTSGNARQLQVNAVDRPATQNFTSKHRLGGEENYTVLSYRRTNSSVVIKANDRTLLQISSTIASSPMYIKYIGSMISTAFFKGVIRAVCMHSVNVSDVVDSQIRSALNSRYNIYSTPQSKLICIGDSITQGASVPTSFPSYIKPLSIAMGLPYVNLGVAGEKASDALIRYQAQAISRPYTDFIYILFGANEITAGISAATCANNIETMILGLINAGFPIRNICLSSPCYRKFGANASTLDGFSAAILAKATALGVRFADPLTAFRSDPDPDSLMGDGTHPNLNGNILLANTAYLAFQGA